ncbi:MAG: hypothetical protein U9N86_13400, partial [Bacteroidota bacterium]|nr:hypothetical protein [Bacteroidota bacterium]
MKTVQITKNLSLLLLFAFLIGSAQAQYSRRAQLRWADDSHYYETQKDKNDKDVLMLVDVVTGKAKKVKGEQPSARAAAEFVRVKSGEIFLSSPDLDEDRQLSANPGLERNPRFSNDKKRIAFTRDHDLYVIDLETGL